MFHNKQGCDLLWALVSASCDITHETGRDDLLPALASAFSAIAHETRGYDFLRALSREGVVSSHSMIATGLCSRHGSEFGTLRAARSCGLETVAQAILGALKRLQRRIKAADWQHSSFGTDCQQLASSQLLPTFRVQIKMAAKAQQASKQLPKYCRAAPREILFFLYKI